MTSGDPEALWAEACRAAEGKEPFTLSLTTVGTTAPVQVCAQFRAATRGNMHEQTPNISMPVFLPEALDGEWQGGAVATQDQGTSNG